MIATGFRARRIARKGAVGRVVLPH
jgi:hypothetical protein